MHIKVHAQVRVSWLIMRLCAHASPRESAHPASPRWPIRYLGPDGKGSLSGSNWVCTSDIARKLRLAARSATRMSILATRFVRLRSAKVNLCARPPTCRVVHCAVWHVYDCVLYLASQASPEKVPPYLHQLARGLNCSTAASSSTLSCRPTNAFTVASVAEHIRTVVRTQNE